MQPEHCSVNSLDGLDSGQEIHSNTDASIAVQPESIGGSAEKFRVSGCC